MCGCADVQMQEKQPLPPFAHLHLCTSAHLHMMYINVLGVNTGLKIHASTIFLPLTVLYTKLRLYCTCTRSFAN